jgi:hypothetical protein
MCANNGNSYQWCWIQIQRLERGGSIIHLNPQPIAQVTEVLHQPPLKLDPRAPTTRSVLPRRRSSKGVRRRRHGNCRRRYEWVIRRHRGVDSFSPWLLRRFVPSTRGRRGVAAGGSSFLRRQENQLPRGVSVTASRKTSTSTTPWTPLVHDTLLPTSLGSGSE